MNILIKQLYDYIINKGFEMDETQLDKAIKYLSYYGYLDKNKTDDVGNIIDAVAKFQEFIGIEVDGIVGPKTSRIMDIPRCGQPDFIQDEARLSKWTKKSLTYYIQSRDKDLSSDIWDSIVYQAAQSLSAVCDIKIQPSNSTNADIVIMVSSNTNEELGVSGGVLAFAYLPNGQDNQLLLKVDGAETWINDVNKNGIMLLNVLAHEMSHNLGCSHISTPGSLMNPYYNKSISKPQKADIDELVLRYGKPTSIPSPSPTPTPEPTNPSNNTLHIEFDSNIKAIQMDGYRIFITSLK